jgi:hypothetical protein
VPVDRSLAGWAVLHDHSVICENMETDPRNFPVDTIPAELQRAICVPLRS